MESIKSKMKRLPFDIYERLVKIAEIENLPIEEVFQVLESRFDSAITMIHDRHPFEMRRLGTIRPFEKRQDDKTV